MNDFAARVARLQEIMQERGAGLTVISFTDQMRYLTGYLEGAHERLLALFIPAVGAPAFLVPSMNAQQAQTNPAGISDVIGWTDSEGWQEPARRLISSFSLSLFSLTEDALVLVDDELYSVHLLELQSLFPKFRYESAGETMAKLRGLKTPTELASLESAAILIDSIFEETLAQLHIGISELELQEFVLTAIKHHHSTPSFTPLVCFGGNGAMPHHRSDSTPLKSGDMVVLDIGCMWDHYCSDITRTVAFGEPHDAEAHNVYRAVSEAHWAARAAVRPGTTCEAIDLAARTKIEEAGYGPQFIHRTGHGIGLSCHESPNINSGVHTMLEPRMCFSIEPGIYLPGRFGVRIENIVTVTSEGVRSLNADPAKDLRVIVPEFAI